ncbi:MAG: septum formation initiator family protein [Acidaminococcaceae bacterium]|nr:septum formation initiator family protein [Acidaminococcaceae bacterium]MDD4721367.1 septum formation initiator family protein [Acidaminococcaceae bacterium]
MKKGNKAFKYFKIVLFVILALFLMRVAQQGYTIYVVNKETARTQEKIKQLEKEQKQLEQEEKNLGDLKYIEKLAREEHNMVRKGEIPLFIIEDKEKSTADSKKTTETLTKKEEKYTTQKH